MPQILPVIPGVEHYEFETELDGTGYVFDVKWNARDDAWYLGAADLDGAPIFDGQKIVLGAYIGRTFRHRLVSAGALVAVDMSSAGIDATFDDFGTRVLLTHWTGYELAAAIRAYAEALRTA